MLHAVKMTQRKKQIINVIFCVAAEKGFHSIFLACFFFFFWHKVHVDGDRGRGVSLS